ncbi:uncharacterized protein LOC135164366 [Diachasmimorpha longicaudata]|uniref:uncharacterized protein LOC135164366 n=1 Tax=Diachasmimorpha longicaudata TaxID=58733 RepID=UPI0030B8F061
MRLLFLLGLVVSQYQVHCQITIAIELISFAWSALEKINTAHDAYSKLTTPSTADIMKKTNEIAESIDKLGNRLEEKIQQSMDTLLTRIPLLGQISADVQLLNSHISRIDQLYGDMEHYLRAPTDFSESALNNLIKSYTSNDGDDVEGKLGLIYGLLIPKGLALFKRSLFLLLAQETQEYGLETCGTGAPPQQRLVELFDIVITTEMRGFAMQGFGALMKGYEDGKNYTGDVKRAQQKLVKRAEEYVLLLAQTMSLAARQFRACDPPKGHVRDSTFYEFEKFLQAFIVQENALRVDHRCPDDCKKYVEPGRVYYGCRGYECTRSPTTCYGRVAYCKRMGTSARACEYDGSLPRRYEWFKDAAGDLYGDDSRGCPAPGSKTYGFKVTSSSNELCEICRCICGEDAVESRSKHFVSLRPQLTNVEDNMVVIGLAFLMKKDIAHVQIMQGQMSTEATILENSTVWMEPEDIEYDREPSEADYTFKFIKRTEDGEIEQLVNDKDVAPLSWEQRRFYLDRLTLPPNYVMTGIKFGTVDSNARSLQLELHATQFDDETGKLDPTTGMWITPDDMPYTQTPQLRQEHTYVGFENPVKSQQTKIDSKPYYYIDMDWTNYPKDAGQTTIPLLDAIPVYSTPFTPLSGVGLYHKREAGYGGFLTLVLEGVDKSRYVQSKV